MTSVIGKISQAAADLLRGRSAPRPLEKFTRDQYKAIWNSVSGSEDLAKLAVSGYTDEELYTQLGGATVELLRATVGVKPDDVILEIGAGVGRVGAALAPLCREWIGTDVSENMVSHITRRLAAFSNVRAVVTNGYDLAPIPSQSVDVVYCTVVFMHLDEWDRYGYVSEAYRILKPGGRLMVDNVNLLSDGGWAFFEEHRAIRPDQRPAQISKTSTPQELAAYFNRASFSEIGQLEAGLWIVTHGVKPLS
ncbi:class I SAM-dependent methyltransferase [uncultured Enterovirga sp.]|uniref:class I SAM-dependent methyltransferase n=1 Tax=uncultured Enterovirga sp. TaxID=2026352 RepID=UPI0035CB0691